MKYVSKFLRSDSGATAIEYGLIAALIVTAVVVSISTLGSKVSTTLYGKIASAF